VGKKKSRKKRNTVHPLPQHGTDSTGEPEQTDEDEKTWSSHVNVLAGKIL
jgi:hypothetical protein